MAPQKINVKERYSDGEIDLSMSDLQDVPVKDIAVFNKTYKLDLSNNNLRLLPGNFASLTFLCALDLSKNQLGELPENFGDLVKLKYLDLYQNQLTHLPLSFSKLKLLRWLDLKDNPLVPAVAKVAGPCLDSKECLACAKDIVNFFSQIQDQISTDMESRQKHRQKQLDLNNQKQKEKSNNQKKKEKNKKNKQSQQQQQQQVQNGPAKEQQQPQPRGGGKSSGKKAKQQQQPTEQQHHWSRFLRFVCYSIFWTVIALFVLTSIKFEYTKNVETAVVHLYSLGLENIPATWQPHYSAAGSYVKIAHLKTANATVMVFECLSGCINYENLDRLKSFVGNLTETVVQKYRQYTS